MDRRTYRNPPIDEAICALYFTSPDDWDLTIPGRLHERIPSYSGKPRKQAGMEAQIGGDPNSPALSLRQSTERIQFPTEDGTRLVAISPEALTIHMLRPYTGWDEEFKDRVNEACDAYQKLSESKIDRIGIRYINRVELPEPNIQLEKYFNLSLKMPKDIPIPLHGFFHRIESSYQDKPIRLAVTFANAKAPEGKAAFILDIDLNWYLDTPLILSGSLDEIGELRDRERNVFESLITDDAREIFDAKPEL